MENQSSVAVDEIYGAGAERRLVVAIATIQDTDELSVVHVDHDSPDARPIARVDLLVSFTNAYSLVGKFNPREEWRFERHLGGGDYAVARVSTMEKLPEAAALVIEGDFGDEFKPDISHLKVTRAPTANEALFILREISKHRFHIAELRRSAEDREEEARRKHDLKVVLQEERERIVYAIQLITESGCDATFANNRLASINEQIQQFDVATSEPSGE